MSSMDPRGFRRGKCTNCEECDSYLNKGGSICSYCSCAPTKHENLGSYFNEVSLNKKTIELQKALEFLENGEDEFTAVYPTFRDERKEIIEELKIISFNLKDLEKRTNIAKLRSSSFKIIGGILAVLCGIFAANPITLSALAAFAGFGVVGGTLDKFTALDKYETTRKGEADKIIVLTERNKRNNKIILDYIGKARKCKSSIDEVMNFEDFRRLAKSVEGINSRNEKIIYEKLKESISNDPAKRRLESFLDFCPSLVSILGNNGKQPTARVNAIEAASNASFESAEVFNRGFDIALEVIECLGKQIQPKSTASLLASQLNLLKDVKDAGKAVYDLTKGSRVEMAEKLDDVVVLLERDLDNCNVIYNAMNKPQVDRGLTDAIYRRLAIQ